MTGRRSRRCLQLSVGSACVLAASLPCLVSTASSSAARTASETPAPVSPADAAATSAYLQDDSTFTQSLIADASASLEAVEAFAAKLAVECPGVLQHAPSAFQPSSASSLKETRTRPRQQDDLQEELLWAIATAYVQANAATTTQLTTSLDALQWSNPTLTQLVHAHAAEDQERVETTIPNVCADMLAWVSSGYKTLSAGTTEFLAHLKAKRARAKAEAPDTSIEQLLVPYESTSDKALVHNLETLQTKLLKSEETGLIAADVHAGRALGVSSPPGEALERAERAVVIARGRTAAGSSYVAKAETRSPGGHGCKVRVSVESRSSHGASPLGGIVFASGNGDCLSSGYAGAHASVECEKGLLTVTADAPAAARAARLLLSDGRQITSRVIRAPRLGGRFGYYYQVVRGPSPIPTSLTELGASGRVLRVIGLPRVVECTKHPIKYLPGGSPRTIARGRVPHGPRFTIVAERYSDLGHVQFELKLRTAEGPGEGSSGFIGGSSDSVIIVGNAEPSLFSIQESTGCDPSPYDIVYGVLKAPGAKVLVRVGGVLRTLHEARIPTRMRAGGVLAYGAFAGAPTQLIVRSARGVTLSSQSRKQSAKASVEECESEREREAEGE
jgi:hypothetical protein